MRLTGHVRWLAKGSVAGATWGNNQQDYFDCVQFPLAITCQPFVNYSPKAGLSFNQKVNMGTVSIPHVIQIKADLRTSVVISRL